MNRPPHYNFHVSLRRVDNNIVFPSSGCNFPKSSIGYFRSQNHGFFFNRNLPFLLSTGHLPGCTQAVVVLKDHYIAAECFTFEVVRKFNQILLLAKVHYRFCVVSFGSLVSFLGIEVCRPLMCEMSQSLCQPISFSLC